MRHVVGCRFPIWLREITGHTNDDTSVMFLSVLNRQKTDLDGDYDEARARFEAQRPLVQKLQMPLGDPVDPVPHAVLRKVQK